MGIRHSHPAPFKKLKCRESVHTESGDADCPFCVGGEIERRKNEQEDAEKYPCRVRDDGEESEAAADNGAGGIEANPYAVKHNDDAKYGHDGLCSFEEAGKRACSEGKDESASETEDRVRKQDATEIKLG